jgi:uncharacterized protein (TIGR02453 family)
MAWFTPDFNKFFIDLAPNNNKEWFDANRKRYEQSVKEPFEAFVAEVIKQVAKVDPKVNITPREAIFRINRDVRFSKDKAPYKSRMSAVVAAGGRKDHSTGGIYFELGPENVAFYGGQYMPEKEQLQGIREHIAANLARFKKLRTAKAFVDRFEGIQGERNKIVPKEFKEAALKEPLIANKQFYFMAELPPSTVSDPKLVQILLDHYKAMKPMNDFLAEGIRRG